MTRVEAGGQDRGVELSEAAVNDVRPLLTRVREDLRTLLVGLSPEDWAMPSAAAGWRVKDLALHLLDDDLGWLSRGRDGDRSGLLVMDDHETFVAALAEKNQRWIDGARGLSARVITDLLGWSGQQVDAHVASMDLTGQAYVSWASADPVPTWFDIARELTERWVHQMQIREVVDRVDDFADRYLPTVLRIFVWALPHQYRVGAPAGITVQVDLGVGGCWLLVSDGSARWALTEGTTADPDARADFTSDTAWRWLTGAELPADGVHLHGAPGLSQPLLAVRGIIA
jgi:hypothetical protein